MGQSRPIPTAKATSNRGATEDSKMAEDLEADKTGEDLEEAADK